MEKFDWNSWTWSGIDQHQEYGQDARHASFVAASRYWTVIPAGGIACYRIRVAHFAVEWTKTNGRLDDPLNVEDSSVSWGECY
jgi:hypothetical protein